MRLNVFQSKRVISSIVILMITVSVITTNNVISLENKERSSFSIINDHSIWSTTQVVSTVSDQRSLRPAITVDSKDNIHIVWEDLTVYDSSGSDSDIFYRFYNSTTETWSTLEIISTESNGNSHAPMIISDESDNLHITWRDVTSYGGSGGDWDVFYKQIFANGSMTTTEVVSTESILNVIWLDIDAKNGVAHVTWQDATNYLSSGSDNDILYKQRFTNGSWSIAEVVSTESYALSRFPSIEIDNKENIHISWDDASNILGAGGDEDVFYKMKNASTGIWSSTEIISTESGADSQRSKLIVDYLGNKHIVWFDTTDYLGAGSDRDIFYKRWDVGSSTWLTTEIVSTESTSSSEVPTLIADKDGGLHALWFDTTNYNSAGVDQDVFYKKWDTNSETWGLTRVISTSSSDDSWRPVVAIDSRSFLHASWHDRTPNYQSSGVDIDIFYTRGIDPDTIAEIEIVSSPDDFTYLVNSTGHMLSWVITDDNITNPIYLIYKNGTEEVNQTWIPDELIEFNVDGFVSGVHNITLVATDGFGNYVEDTVMISVTSVEENEFDSETLLNAVYGVLITVGVVSISMILLLRRRK